MRALAAQLEGKKWAHLNSTFEGGGVAEILKSAVPITRGLGIECEWHCMEGDEAFFVTTKKMHNAIQGVEIEFSQEELFDRYLGTAKRNFSGQTIDADFTLVHDPQPCPAIIYGAFEGKVIWRCHIDTTAANELIWDFLLPYINNYDGAVFSHRAFLRGGVNAPRYIIPPAIDPLSFKNRRRSRREALTQLGDLFTEYDIDGDRPVILAVSRYDVHKNQAAIVAAFKNLKQHKVFREKKPQLIIVGNLATDDPEGAGMYAKIVTQIDDDPDIYALLNIPDNDKNIGALMSLAEVFVHISTKEGFGLVVTEALWQGTPVIGSRVGGITLQVRDGESGFLVHPNEIDKITDHMAYFLTHREEREKMGLAAREHVKNNFLMTGLVKNYLMLMRHSLGLGKPHFAV
ncbi:MAG: glycosyltransferase [Saprospiraceae bacterium]|nr:glycosyltransferase [Saprospiraceae bacterium]